MKKRAGYLCCRLNKTVSVGGIESKLVGPPHFIGAMLVFDDYAAALDWVNGDRTAVRQVVLGDEA